jgi:hypothetical protein
VADRFHVLTNLVEALQQVLGRDQARLNAAAQVAQSSGGPGAPVQVHSRRPRGDTAPARRALGGGLAPPA